MGAALSTDDWRGPEWHPALLLLSIAGAALGYGCFRLLPFLFGL